MFPSAATTRVLEHSRQKAKKAQTSGSEEKGQRPSLTAGGEIAMSVYRPAISKVWWYDFIFEGQRVRESAKTRSKTIAKDAEKARRRELEESYNGIKRRDRAKLFSIATDDWLQLKDLTLSTSSRRIERSNLKHLGPFFDRRLITDIQARDVRRYQHARIAEKASPKTINLEV